MSYHLPSEASASRCRNLCYFASLPVAVDLLMRQTRANVLYVGLAHW
jgi:hypothetical protein